MLGPDHYVHLTVCSRNVGAEANCCEFLVTVAFSYGNLFDLTNTMIKVPKVGVQRFERQATLHLHIQQYMGSS